MRAKLGFLFLVWVLSAGPMFGAKVVLVAGGGTNLADGIPATEAKLSAPFGVDFDSAGNMYVAEMTGQRVRKVDARGRITTVAGTGAKGDGGDDGLAREALFNGPHNLAVTADGDLYLADTWNNCVRKIDSRTQKISRVAGTGQKGFAGDGGPSSAAKFGGIYCVSLDPAAQSLYAADLDNRRVRRLDLQTGLVRTVAGNGTSGTPQDGAQAVNAPLVDPRAVIADAAGNVYVLERSGHALRVVDADGKIRTVAGTGTKGDSGDDGPAHLAALNGPKHLCFDLEGNILIADTENHRVRKLLLKEGRMVGVAGNGTRGRDGLGGPPAQVQLNQPHGVHVHRTGAIYISDSSNDRVLKIEP